MSEHKRRKPASAKQPPAPTLPEQVGRKTLWIEPLEERTAPGVIWGT